MKKTLLIVLSILILLGMTACKNETNVHNHSYVLQEDGTLKCSCGSRIVDSYWAEMKDAKNVKSYELLKNGHYENTGSAKKDVVIYSTDGENLTINAPNDSIRHLGVAGDVVIEAVADNSYHGKAKAETITLKQGRVIIEDSIAATAEVKIAPEKNVSVKLDIEQDIEIAKVSVVVNLDISVEIGGSGKISEIDVKAGVGSTRSKVTIKVSQSIIVKEISNKDKDKVTVEPSKTIDYLSFTALVADSTISAVISREGVIVDNFTVPDKLPILEYSKDGITWKDFVIGVTNVNLSSVGDKIFLRAKDKNETFSMFSDYNEVVIFKMSGSISADGNVMSLLDKNLTQTTVPKGAFAELFSDCTCLVSAPKLPATTLGNDCYSCMFYNCSSLKKTPELPAMSLGDSCYWRMFGDCTSLVETSDLPALTMKEGCYGEMFSGCSSLNNVPNSLPATELAQQCYVGMFMNCTSLTEAPELVLATVLGLDCYGEMFSGCSSLKLIKVNMQTWQETGNWVEGVGTGGVFVCPATLPRTYDSDHIPVGWEVR